MALSCKHSVTPVGMTINYGREFKNGRTNRGFSDLRGRPELAAKIREAAGSPMLRELLIAASLPSARMFTIGCDLGGHREPALRSAEVSGGYLQLAFQEYSTATNEQYFEEAKRLEHRLSLDSRGHRWRAAMRIRHGCRFRLGMDPEVEAPTLLVHFWALGREVATALMSREAFLASLKASIAPFSTG